MDILNWIYLKKHKLIKDSVQDSKDLVILGSNVGIEKRGDIYQSYAVPYSAFAASVAEGGCFTPDISTDSVNVIADVIGHYSKIGNLVTLHIKFDVVYDPVIVGDNIVIILPTNLIPTSVSSLTTIGEIDCPSVNVLYGAPAAGLTYFTEYSVKMNDPENIRVLISPGSDDHPFRDSPSITYFINVTYPLNPSIC